MQQENQYAIKVHWGDNNLIRSHSHITRIILIVCPWGGIRLQSCDTISYPTHNVGSSIQQKIFFSVKENTDSTWSVHNFQFWLVPLIFQAFLFGLDSIATKHICLMAAFSCFGTLLKWRMSCFLVLGHFREISWPRRTDRTPQEAMLKRQALTQKVSATMCSNETNNKNTKWFVDHWSPKWNNKCDKNYDKK